MPNEIELKLRIAMDDVPRLRRHGALRRHLVGKPVTRRLVSIYYDTPDLQLLDAAISLRVRRMSGGWFQAVKAAGHSLAGLHQRMEWEDIIARGEPDFTKITEPSLATLFAEQDFRDSLSPIFTTDVQRTEWHLEYADGSTIEVALDLGELWPGQKNASKPADRIQEVELELKHGKASHIFELALALQADIPLHIENASKAQRGYAFYRAALVAVQPETAALSADADADEAFRLYIGQCLQQMQYYRETLFSAEQRGSIEPMYAAMQRLACTLKLFKLKHAELKDALDWLSCTLKEVRNWDIFINKLLPEFASPGEQNLLRQHVQTAYSRAWAQLQEALESQRYQRLLLSLGACMANGTPTTKKLQSLISDRLQKQHQKLKQHKQDPLPSNPKTLNKLQTITKQLCYNATLLATGQEVVAKHRKYLAKLADFEKSLEVLEQIALTQTLAERLLRQDHGESPDLTLGRLLQWNEQRAAPALANAAMSRQALLKTRPDWK